MPDRPNIVIIMTDQQRADFSGGEGFPLDLTPCLDQLGQRGVRFNRAYTVTPICLPARISMFTGRYPTAHGIRGNYPCQDVTYSADLLDIVKGLGYRTYLMGKNHSHHLGGDFDAAREYAHDRSPLRDGREDDKAFQDWMIHLNHNVSEEPTPFALDCQYPVRIVDDAIGVLEGPSDKPFFMWLSFPEPHNPFQVPEPYWNMYPPDVVPPRAAGPEALATRNYHWRYERDLIAYYRGDDFDRLWPRYRSNYCGMIRLLDDQLKRFLAFMAEAGLAENTIFLFLADHGDYATDYGLFRKGVGLPECLTRIPMVWWGAGVESHDGFHPAHVSLADVMPTLCEVLGVGIPVGVQGRSLWPLLTGQSYPQQEFESVYAEQGNGGVARDETDPPDFEHASLGGDGHPNLTFSELNETTQSGRRRMVRKGDWKLLVDLDLGNELYNLVDDPAELNDLYDVSEYADVKNDLMESLLKWTIRLADDLPLEFYTQKRPAHNWEWC